MEEARCIPALGYFPEPWCAHFWLYLKNILIVLIFTICIKHMIVISVFVSLSQILWAILSIMCKVIYMYCCVYCFIDTYTQIYAHYLQSCIYIYSGFQCFLVCDCFVLSDNGEGMIT